jgi:uncharacterized membrane protein
MTRGLETIARGEASRIGDPQRVVVRTEREWRALWAAHAGAESAPPAVAFDHRIVAGVFLGTRRSDPSGVSIAGYRHVEASLELLVEQRPPGANEGPGNAANSRPYHLVSLPRFDGVVRFVDADAGGEPVRPEARATDARAESSSSTGLEPPIAGALAYLAGPFSGALLLTVERTNQFVRFHAWQALIALGLLGALAVGCLALAFFLLLFSPTAFRAMLWISAILGVTWLAVWAICLWQAYRGQRWKLPIAGAYADRLAR